MLQLSPPLVTSSHEAKPNTTGTEKYILPMEVTGEVGNICWPIIESVPIVAYQSPRRETDTSKWSLQTSAQYKHRGSCFCSVQVVSGAVGERQYGILCPQLRIYVAVCWISCTSVLQWQNAPKWDLSSQLTWSPLTVTENSHMEMALLQYILWASGWVSCSHTSVTCSPSESPPTCIMAGSLQTHYSRKSFWGVLSSKENKGKNFFSIIFSLNWRLHKIEKMWSSKLCFFHDKVKNVAYRC